MKDWYGQLKTEYKVAIWSAIITIGLVILCIPFFFFSLMEIPQGIALGGAIGVMTYLLLGLFENKDKPTKSLVLTIVTISLRLIIIGGILFLVGWLYYAKGVKAFNIFAVAGAYLISLVANIILIRKEQ